MGDNPKIDAESAELEVRAVGDALGVILPKALADRLRLRSGDRLIAVAQADGSIAFAPVQDAHAKTKAAAQRVLAEYAETFRILAK